MASYNWPVCGGSSRACAGFGHQGSRHLKFSQKILQQQLHLNLYLSIDVPLFSFGSGLPNKDVLEVGFVSHSWIKILVSSVLVSLLEPKYY